MWTQIFMTGLNLGLNFLLIPRFAAAGAVGAGLATAAINTAISYNISRRFFFVPHAALTWWIGIGLVGCASLPYLVGSRVTHSAVSCVALVLLLAATHRSLRLMRHPPRAAGAEKDLVE